MAGIPIFSQLRVVAHTYGCLVSDHPGRSLSKVASQHFLEVASTPPLQGGEYAQMGW